MTQVAPVVQMISLAQIHESKSNPRKTFQKIEELAEDLKVRGILQPVLVRAGTNGHADGFELVFGARRYRAAKLAKLPALPAFVRELTDKEVLELQIVENSQRDDVHPIEEADGYRRLHEEFAYSVEEIAAKVGKSRSAVYERIKLCALVPAAREAFFAGKLSASTALLVARIPDKELQQRAVKDIGGRAGDDPMSYREAVDHIHARYMLQLKDAPFDTGDAKLVAKAGPCTTCPKRTGNQAELFSDVRSPDVCTDPGCYGEKKDALWKLQTAKAKEAGQKVLPDGEAKKLLRYGQLSYDAPYVDLAAKDYGHGGKTYKELIASKKDAPAPVLARDEKGDVHELLPRAAFNKLTGRKERAGSTFDPKKQAELQARRDKEQKQQEKLERAVTEKLVAAAEKGAATAAFWRLLVRVIAAEPYMVGWTLKRRQIAHGKLARQIEKLNDRQLRGFVLELVLELASEGQYVDGGATDAVLDACRVLGVDYVKVANQVLDTTVAQSCPTCHRVAAVKSGVFEKHEGREDKPCKSSGQPIQRIGSGPALAAGILCAIPGCGKPGKRTKGAPGLWCASHGKLLSVAEKKSIDARNKRLTAEGKAAAPAPAKRKPSKKK